MQSIQELRNQLRADERWLESSVDEMERLCPEGPKISSSSHSEGMAFLRDDASQEVKEAYASWKEAADAVSKSRDLLALAKKSERMELQASRLEDIRKVRDIIESFEGLDRPEPLDEAERSALRTLQKKIERHLA